MGRVPLDDRQIFIGRCQRDFELFARTCLKIRVLGGVEGSPYVPFVLNHEQKVVLRYFRECEAARKPVRAMILKARKLGMSTFCQAYAYWKCCFSDSFRAVTVAHLKESALEIADIPVQMNDRLPDVLSFLGAQKSAGGLAWPSGSKLRVFTARSDDVTRGGTPSFVLLSEASAYDHRRETTSADDFLSSTLGSIEELPGTYIIMETTARGSHGTFYERWKKEESAGRYAMWKRFFFDWQSSEKYAPGGGLVEGWEQDDLPRHADMKDAVAAGRIADARELAGALGYLEPHTDRVSEVWMMRAAQYDLPPPQVRWAMKQHHAKWNGDLVRFDREFPVSTQVAFTAGGRTVFPRQLVDRWQQMDAPQPVASGGRIVPRAGEGYQIDPAGQGWDLYEWPEAGHEYVIGIDAAGGTGIDDAPEKRERGCFAALCLLDRHTRRQVGQFYSRMCLPDELAHQAALAGLWYYKALVVPEVNNHGGQVVRTLLQMGYRNIYRRHPGKTLRAGANYLHEFGVATQNTNRTALVDGLVTACLRGPSDPRRFEPRAPAFVAEAPNFVFDAVDRPGAMPHTDDDAIFAAIMAVEGDRVLPDVIVPRPQIMHTDPVKAVIAEHCESGHRRWTASRRRLRQGRHA